jgi:hypothetical protein
MTNFLFADSAGSNTYANTNTTKSAPFSFHISDHYDTRCSIPFQAISYCVQIVKAFKSWLRFHEQVRTGCASLSRDHILYGDNNDCGTMISCLAIKGRFDEMKKTKNRLPLDIPASLL